MRCIFPFKSTGIPFFHVLFCKICFPEIVPIKSNAILFPVNFIILWALHIEPSFLIDLFNHCSLLFLFIFLIFVIT